MYRKNTQNIVYIEWVVFTDTDNHWGSWNILHCTGNWGSILCRTFGDIIGDTPKEFSV